MRYLAVLLALVLAPAASAAAPRERVLKQIAVPHHYYYREMYLPQATSGPNAVAWFPDGQSVVVAMQGSLWRHTLSSEAATQLTDGPGYDNQPDVSPDGRFVAYSSYRGDAIDLLLLDVASGATSVLVKNGAVNVEPRFSPDGKRIAFVSTVFNARWHVFTLALDAKGAAAGEPRRITNDSETDQRYYYSKWDHFLSPVWSPDGSELILVGNHGHVWGTGGFWRMQAEPGAAARELHYEETNWKARPDWSPDGKRVVYSSYLGRQWNQLWLMPAAGGDALQLTYGEFDNVAPRWSKDGRQIAYITNEGGNTALRILAFPGGAVSRPRFRHKNYKNPGAQLAITVTDGARPVPARISVTAADGRGYTPDDTWRHADDAYVRGARAFEYSYFHTSGRASLRVPAGSELTIEVSRGPEYAVHTQKLTLAAGASQRLAVPLRRIDDLPKKGWWSGDGHVHMNYGGAYRNDPAHLVTQMQAEDLHLVENLVVNKEGRIPDISYFRPTPDPASRPGFLLAHGQEFHTSFWGHTGLLGQSDHFLLPDYAGYAGTAAASLIPMNFDVADMARAQGGIIGYVHPWDYYPDPAKRDEALTNELPVDAALGKVDYYEVVGFIDDYLANSKVWYQLLNCGFRIPAGAGTDAMANYSSLRGPVGMNRVFVKAGLKLEHGAWLAGLKAGRTFATNGPLLSLAIDGKEPGAEIKLPAGSHTLHAAMTMKSYVPVTNVELVRNGEVMATAKLAADGRSASGSAALEVKESGWYVLRAWSKEPQYPVLDVYPFASTSPIYVTVGDDPVRSARDAAYFIAWIDRVAEAAGKHDGWASDAERATAMERIAAARKVFTERAQD